MQIESQTFDLHDYSYLIMRDKTCERILPVVKKVIYLQRLTSTVAQRGKWAG